MRSKKILTFLEFLIISTYSFLFFSHLRSFSYFLIFQERDIERARKLVEGNLIFFGPEMFGGGHLPGGFYYFLLSIPHFLGFDWSVCWHLMIFLLSVGIGLSWIFTVSIFGYYSAIILITLLFNSSTIIVVERLFYNPSFLPFFTICSIIGLCLTFSKIPVSKKRYWIATCFLLGLAIQIHFNAFFILLSGIFLQMIANRIKIVQMNKSHFFTGLIIFVLTLLPYFLSNILGKYGITIGQQTPLSSGSSFNAPMTLISHFLHGLLNLSPELILRNVMFQLQPEVLLCLLILPLGCLIFSHVYRRHHATAAQQEAKHHDIFIILIIIAVFNVLPQLLFFSFVGLDVAYYTINVAFIIAFIASAMSVNGLTERQKGTYYYLIFACLVIIALYKFFMGPEYNPKAIFEISTIYYVVIFMMLAGIMILKKQSYTTIVPVIFMLCLPNISLKYNLRLPPDLSDRTSKMINIDDIKSISRHIINETCWDFPTARKKIMRMNILSELGLREIYLKELKYNTYCKTGQNPDGYIMTVLDNSENKTKIEEFPHEWLLSKQHHIIHEYMMNDNLRVRKPVFFNNAVLLEYDLKNSETHNSLSIQNIGYSYEENEMDNYFRKYSPGVSQIRKGIYFIHWNNCPEHEEQCSIGFLLDLNGHDYTRNIMKVSIIGPSLATPSICLIPDWSTMLISPYITFICDGKQYKKKLAKRLGGVLESIHNSDLISAPFETHVVNPCKDDTCQITVGWDSLVISSFSKGLMSIPDLPITIYDIEKRP